MEGVDCRGFERVDLLGDAHRAQLRANACADAARQEETGRQRSRSPSPARSPGPPGSSASAPNLSSDARVCIERTTPTARPDTAIERRRAHTELVDLSNGFPELERRERKLRGQLSRRRVEDFTALVSQRTMKPAVQSSPMPIERYTVCADAARRAAAFAPS